APGNAAAAAGGALTLTLSQRERGSGGDARQPLAQDAAAQLAQAVGLELAHPLAADAQPLADLGQRQRRAVLEPEAQSDHRPLALPPHLAQPRQQLAGVYRHADRARLVGDRPGHTLADPPVRVGREAPAALRVVLLDGPEQAEVALLDQVLERQPAVDVAPRD